jgi:hypothetical protein
LVVCEAIFLSSVEPIVHCEISKRTQFMIRSMRSLR